MSGNQHLWQYKHSNCMEQAKCMGKLKYIASSSDQIANTGNQGNALKTVVTFWLLLKVFQIQKFYGPWSKMIPMQITNVLYSI